MFVNKILVIYTRIKYTSKLEVEGKGYSLRGSHSVQIVLSHSEKGSTVKGKNLLLLGANASL